MLYLVVESEGRAGGISWVESGVMPVDMVVLAPSSRLLWFRIVNASHIRPLGRLTKRGRGPWFASLSLGQKWMLVPLHTQHPNTRPTP